MMTNSTIPLHAVEGAPAQPVPSLKGWQHKEQASARHRLVLFNQTLKSLTSNPNQSHKPHITIITPQILIQQQNVRA